jgi:hypothetical protein
MTLLSAGVSSGFSLAGLLGPGRDDSFGGYARFAKRRLIADGPDRDRHSFPHGNRASRKSP